MMKIGIVVCSRTDSSRLPGKPFIKIKNKCILAYLIDRLVEGGMPIYIAVPDYEVELYEMKLDYQLNKYRKQLFIFGGTKKDPLKRMLDVANKYNLDHVIRVCHDKIFVDCRQMHDFVAEYLYKESDYVYSTNFIDGMGFEIISRKALIAAHHKYKDVEDVSHAMMDVAERPVNFQSFCYNLNWLRRKARKRKLRLLIDYKSDLDIIRDIIENLGDHCSIEDIIHYSNAYKSCLPMLTMYTCSYNDHKYLSECIESILVQRFKDIEYILVNDGSTDPKVSDVMRSYESDVRLKIINNPENIGLSSSSNVALNAAKGKYIMRVDADDYLISPHVLSTMLHKIRIDGCEIIYPDNLRGNVIQGGREMHHVGGTMFRKKALDFLCFTEGLRHFEGLDLYKRAKKHNLKIGYYHHIGFYYRQHDDSMSKSRCDERQNVKCKLDRGLMGACLL